MVVVIEVWDGRLLGLMVWVLTVVLMLVEVEVKSIAAMSHPE